MALSERSRHQIYDLLSTTQLDEEVISEVLSYFPGPEVEEPVTRSFLTSELALVRIETHNDMADLRTDLRGEIAQQGADLRGEIRAVDAKVDVLDAKVTALDAKVTALDAKVTALDAKVTALDDKVDDLAARIGEVEGSLHVAMREQLRWLIGTQLAVIAIVVAIAGMGMLRV